MFPSGTQRKHWTFSSESEVTRLRQEANERYIQNHGSHMSPEEQSSFFLNPAEEHLLMRHFEFILREFCKKFNPTMPKYVQGTALTYFKRFYIHNSIMDYHPRDVMLTSVYMACKVEEFNVSIGQFVGNLKGDREKFANIILGFELMLMDKLYYHLTIHNPFRPLEGFFIDIKTRYKAISDVERLRPGAEEFLDKSLATDACLIFSPSQIALASVVSSSGKEGLNLDSYVTNLLMKGADGREIKQTIYQIKRVKYMIQTQEPLQRETLGSIQKKLESCRNQENNPESEIYKRKMEEMFEDEEEMRSRKRAKLAEEENRAERSLLGN